MPRERQAPHPPETIAGTLAYMAPEQTGRMNRSIDSRSDLYALGVTFYQMLTGALPFTAADPMEWVHCHLARRPVAPGERLRDIPGVISAIVMKLLAKMAEDRYQTAAGLEGDLRRCRDANGRRSGAIDDFPLGEHDTPDRLLIPEKLYGRRARGRDLACRLRSRRQGWRSGIGPGLGLFRHRQILGRERAAAGAGAAARACLPPASSTSTSATSPIRPWRRPFRAWSGRSWRRATPNSREWREALREALGPNGQLMVDLVPELKLDHRRAGAGPGAAAAGRAATFSTGVPPLPGVFARPEHPLALFLDDLQWLDAATLDLLEDLLIHPDVPHLLLIGAYRDNEVRPAHPLVRRLEAIRRQRKGAGHQAYVL